VPARGEGNDEKIDIPTIGIGAGWHCDGQVQVFHDLLGLYTEFLPKHAKRYANAGETIIEAVRKYAEDVRTGRFPTEKQSFIAKKQPAAKATESAGVG
jgi:3-methyl-2-oxobutanoate hydroxymethyltransferase